MQTIQKKKSVKSLFKKTLKTIKIKLLHRISIIKFLMKEWSLMKRTVAFIMFLFVLWVGGCGSKVPMDKTSSKDLYDRQYNTVIKRDLLCIMMAYPEYILGIEKGKDGNVYIVMKSQRRILYDDKRVKTPAEKIANADIQDMLEQVYPLNDIKKLPEQDCDPGRARVYALLKEVYGSSKGKVQSNLVNVKTLQGYFQFNKNNGASEAFQKAFNELVPLAQNRQNIRASVFPTSGTFNYRNIAGTNLLSPHSFGIAIDLARNKRDYWKWASRREGEERLASYPREIVAVFEKYNFIWGGKWGHFDILHFEYRPEIIYKARYFGNMPDSIESWYDRAPAENPEVKNYIDIIEKTFE